MDDGAAQFSIPLALPPGSNGQIPKLDIVYNSRKLNGFLGQGAGIGGLSSIARCPAKVILDGFSSSINFDANDRFCLDGQRLIAVAGTYGAHGTEYRTEIDSFSRIYSRGVVGSGPAYFIVETKSGNYIKYGGADNSSIAAAGRTDIKRWAIDKNIDRFGNYIEYMYAQGGNASSYCTVSDLQTGEYVPCRINYTGNTTAAVTPFASIIFSYETRPDVQAGYVGSTVEIRSKRISKINTYTEGVLVKSYKMTYKINAANNNSQLTDVQECNGENIVSCKRPVHINWENACIQPIAKNKTDLVTGSDWNVNTFYTASKYSALNGDFNGDAMTDMILIGDTSSLFCSGPGMAVSNNCVPISGIPYTKDDNVQQGDYNGDGIIDLYIIGSSASYLCKGPIANNGGNVAVNCVSSSIYNLNKQYNIVTADFNGDSHADLLLIGATSSQLCLDASLGGIKYYKSGSTSSGKTTVGGGCSAIAGSAWKDNYIPKTGDFNGDGYNDLFLLATSRDSLFCKGSAAGLVNACVLVSSNGWLTVNSLKDNVSVGDFNGDGYADLFVHGATRASIGNNRNRFCAGPNLTSSNYCTGTITSPSTPASELLSSLRLHLNYSPGIAYPGDFNNDGRTDLFIAIYEKLYFCDSYKVVSGGTCVEVTPTMDLSRLSRQLSGSEFVYYDALNYGIYLGDYNGDGNTDVFMAGPTKAYFSEGIDSGKSVIKVTDSVGKVNFFDYTTLANTDVYTAGYGSSSTGVNLHIPMQVVSSYKVSNAAESLNEYIYSYNGAMFNVDRGYLGFTSRTVTDVQKNISTTESYLQNYPFIGQTLSQTVSKLSGQPVSKITNNYLSIATNGGKTVFPYPQSQTTDAYDLNTGTQYATTTLTNSVDDFGNIIHQLKTITDNLSAESFTTTTVNNYDYKNSTVWGIKGLLTRSEETRSGSQGTSPTISRVLEYDNGSPYKGLLTKDTLAQGTVNELNKRYSYDAFGNKTTAVLSPLTSMAATDKAYFAPRTTTLVYEPKGRFPYTQINSLNQTETYTYNESFGVRTDTVAVDNTKTHWDYDTFGQQIALLRPDGTRQTVQRQWDTTTSVESMLPGTHGSGHLSRYKITTREYAKDGITEFLAPVTNVYNTTGNIIRVATQGFDGAFVYTDANYDVYGRKFAISRPYYATDISGKYPTHIQYDELDRVVQTDDPAGVIATNSYNGLTTASTKAFNGKNQTTVTVSNALGQPKSVTDANLQTLNYSYANTAMGRIERIMNPANNTIEMEYDLVGNKIRMQDPDMGTWTYGYNALGEQTWLKSPKNSLYTSLFEYDTLGRNTKRTDYITNGSVENVSTWTYDTQVPGKLSVIATARADTFKRSFAYDTLGRIDTVTSRIMSADYVVDYGYDTNDGRLKTIKYPTGFEVKNNFNSHGYLSQVVNAVSPTTVYWQGNATTADGQFSNIDYGNGVNIIHGFKPESGRIDFIDAAKSGIMLQHNSYTFDGMGNLLSRNDMLNNHYETFSYDALNRLASTALDGTATTLAYDDLGNITTMPGVGSYTYSTARPHAVESITGTLNSGFTYDANGNMQSGNNRNITWTSFDKPRQITRASNSSVYASFAYDADFNRTVQTTNTGQTVYLNPETSAGAHYEKSWGASNQEHRHYIYAGDNLVALHTTKNGAADTISYFLKDHLGSTEVITNSTGQVIERLNYAAFGNHRVASTWLNSTTLLIAQSTTRGYTGHEQLDALGLINMNGRLYDPQIGRFISADPYIQDIANLQSFNRYSYVMNNPLSFTDPTGYVSEGTDYGSPYNYVPYNPGSSSSWTMFDGSAYSGSSGNTFSNTNTYINLNFSPLDYGSSSYQNISLYAVPAGTYGLNGDNYSGFSMLGSLGTTAVLDDFAAQGRGLGLAGARAAAGVTALGIGSLALTLRGDTPEGVYLFRVVDDIELGRVMKTQEFSGVSPSGREGKEFWLNIVDARNFAEKQFRMSEAFGNVSRTILQAQTSRATLGLGDMFPDAGNNNAMEIYFPSYVMPQVNSDIRAHGGIIMRDRYDAR